ncbi:MAG: polysaccharide deacetylase family protein [Clostridia bacterium]
MSDENSQEKSVDSIKERKKMSKTKKIVLSLILLVVLAIVSFVIYEIATVDNTYYIGEKNLQIPVFVYHDIVADESEVEYDYMQTTVEKFEEQMTGLMKLGYKPISYEDLVAYSKGEIAIPKWSFLVTFDDGYAGVYKYAYEIAKKYNIPMTSFLIDDCVGLEGYYTWEQAKEMNDSGIMSIYSHGLTHSRYNEKTKKELVQETEKAYTNLRKKLDDENILKVFTYPYGLYTREQRSALKEAGYVQNLTDNRINTSNKLELSGLHRDYPLNDSVFKIILKIQYRAIRYQ